ncbi:MAG: ABC transporter substrate-binding protein, partial [Candidatus Thorarchaeota archaeon]
MRKVAFILIGVLVISIIPFLGMHSSQGNDLNLNTNEVSQNNELTDSFKPSVIPLGTDVINSYHSRTGPFIDEIVFKTIYGESAQVSALENNEIDFIDDGVNLTLLAGNPDISIANRSRNGYGLTYLNCDRWPLNYTALRRAIAFAVDKYNISNFEYTFDGDSQPQDCAVPIVNPLTQEGQLPYSYYSANISQGNQLLDDAGFTMGATYRNAPNGSAFQIEVYYYLGSNIHRNISEMFVTALHNLDIDAISVGESDFFGDYLPNAYDGIYDLAFMGYNLDDDFSVDALLEEYWSALADDMWRNIPRFRNSTYDSYIEDLMNSTDINDVNNAIVEMQQILAYECPFIICYNNYEDQLPYRTTELDNFIVHPIESIYSWLTP